MFLHYYRYLPNFGDVLNLVIWPKYISSDLDSPASENEDAFVGIGTLINENLPVARRLHIFGSGAGYGKCPVVAGKNWDVHFVRGPLTAKCIGVPASLAISDPAIIINRMSYREAEKIFDCSFMPHHEIDSSRFRLLCESVGINYISPLAPCDEVIDSILGSRRLICSAMHGAIVAEALRVPWLPVITNSEILKFKWQDWAEAMELKVSFSRLLAIWPETRSGLVGKTVASIKEGLVKQTLEKLSASNNFILGREEVLENRLCRIEEKIFDFNYNHGRRC
jgi:succinoglycan biosynthesis protein ExoV